MKSVRERPREQQQRSRWVDKREEIHRNQLGRVFSEKQGPEINLKCLLCFSFKPFRDTIVMYCKVRLCSTYIFFFYSDTKIEKFSEKTRNQTSYTDKNINELTRGIESLNKQGFITSRCQKLRIPCLYTWSPMSELDLCGGESALS